MPYSFIDLQEEWNDLMIKTLRDEPRDFTKLRDIARCIDGINCDGTDEELVHSVKWFFRNLIAEDDNMRHNTES